MRGARLLRSPAMLSRTKDRGFCGLSGVSFAMASLCIYAFNVDIVSGTDLPSTKKVLLSMKRASDD